MTLRTEHVTMVALDSFNFPKAPAFIKLDVEGCELDVLKGATNFLKAANYPPICFEAWSFPWFADDKAELMAFLQGLGYEISQFATDDYIAQHPANAVHVKFDLAANGVLSIERVR